MEVKSCSQCTNTQSVCTTAGFMFGMIIGSVLHTTDSWWSIIGSVVLATVVFHVAYIRNVNIFHLFKQVIKKGS
jgi:hypothetical protein